MVDYLVDHPTNHITMVVQFTTIAAWLWQISKPYPLGASLEGVGWVQSSSVLFSLTMRLRKKNISIHKRFILLFYIPPDSFATKTMESRFPHSPPLSNLLTFLSSIMPACFWLVVAFEISIGSHLRPRHFIFFIFLLLSFRPKRWYGVHPTHSAQIMRPPQYPSYREHQLLVGCCVVWPKDGHLRPRSHSSL